MKTIRFGNGDKRKFAATLRKNVNTYLKENSIPHHGSSQMIVKAVVMHLIYIMPFVAMLVLPMAGWMIFPLSLIMGIGMAGIGMSVMHDAAHGSFSRNSTLNRFVSGSMYLLGGNVFTWKIQHNLFHHTYTNIDGFDEDINSKAMFRFSKHSELKKIHRFQHIYIFFFYGLMTISKLVRDFFQLHEYNKTGVTQAQKACPKRELTKMIISKVAYMVIALGLPLVFSSFSWWLIILGFLVMHFSAGMIMSIIFQLAHVVEGTEQPLPDEKGTIENDWIIHEFHTTANFARNSRVLSWFAGGLNYQIEHHLFPNICHVHYRKIAPIVERTALEFGIPYMVQPSFLTAVGSHMRTLKQLGR
jgi:linoleoyl-CoA desaturase